MTFRKKPGVAFWATVVLVVGLAYPLSFGPVFWAHSALWPKSGPRILDRALETIYCPLGHQTGYGPRIVKRSLQWYLKLGADRQYGVSVPLWPPSRENWLLLP